MFIAPEFCTIFRISLPLNLQRFVIVLLAITPTLSGCAGVPAGGGTHTAVERAMQNCIGSVLIGAIGGAVIGGILGGGRSAARGALVGGGAGSALCVVMLAVANEEDKKRIRALEQAAVSEGADKTETYERQGVKRNIHTRVYGYSKVGAPTDNSKNASSSNGSASTSLPSPQSKPTASERVCRYAETTVEVAGKGVATAGKQLYCRTAAGDWEPVSSAA